MPLDIFSFSRKLFLLPIFISLGKKSPLFFLIKNLVLGLHVLTKFVWLNYYNFRFVVIPPPLPPPTMLTTITI